MPLGSGQNEGAGRRATPLRSAGAVFALLFLTYAGFFQASTWGAACRFDLARALTDEQTIRIDAYHENTGDKAFFDGHYYSDKAPLPSFLAVPGVALGNRLRPLFADAESGGLAPWLAMTAGLATLFATGFLTALGGAVYYHVLRARGGGTRGSWGITMFIFLGTPLLPYGTLLQGHAPAAAWLVFFFAAVFPAAGVPSRWRSLLAGVAATGALATEYLTGPPLVMLAAASLYQHRAVAPRHALAMAAGALPGLVLLGAYHQAAFGSPFALGYQHVALPFFQQKMATGLFGIGVPNPVVALRLLFEPYRGLFIAAPILLLALPGFLTLVRDHARRAETWAALCIAVFYWLLTSGYATWHGGWAIGPRHLVPAIPFLGLGLAVTWPRWSKVVVVVGAISVLLMLAATTVQPEVPEDIRYPFAQHLLPHFARGEYSISEQGFADLYPARSNPAEPDRWDAFLIGEALRLPRHAALLPTLAIWWIFSPLGPLGPRGTSSSLRPRSG